MNDTARYREYAEECRKLAQQAPAHGEALLRIAEAWTALADQMETKTTVARQGSARSS